MTTARCLHRAALPTRRLLIGTLIGSFVCSCSSPNEQTDLGAGGSGGGLVFEKHVIDAGVTTQSQVTFEARVRNRTESSIRLVGIQKSCACTLTGLSLPAEIPAHGVLSIPISMTLSRTAPGRISQRLSLETDESRPEPYVVLLRATVEPKPELRVVPDLLDFGEFGGWEEPARNVKITYASGASFRVDSISPSSSLIRVTPKGVYPNGYVEYEVTLRREFPAGDAQERIQFVTTHGVADLPITGRKMKRVFCSPSLLMLAADERLARRKLLIRHDPTIDLSDVRVASSVVDVSVNSMRSLSPDKLVIELTIKCKALEDSQAGKLAITSPSHGFEPIAVEVFVAGKERTLNVETKRGVGDPDKSVRKE